LASPNVRPGPRPRRDALPTREAILDAGLGAFAAQGFGAVTLTDVARQAGVAQPLVHYHFESKEGLWRAVVARAFAELEVTFEHALDELRGVGETEKIEILLRRFVHFSARHPELHRLIAHEASQDGPRLDWLVQQHLGPLIGSLDAVILEAQQAGRLKDLPQAHLSQIAVGAVMLFFTSGPLVQRLYGIDPTEPAHAALHADVVTEVLLRGLEQKTEEP
jgi:AcrR family transcriptional regulator